MNVKLPPTKEVILNIHLCHYTRHLSLGVRLRALALGISLVGNLGIALAGDGAKAAGLPAELVIGGASALDVEDGLAKSILVADGEAGGQGGDLLALSALPELAAGARGGLDAAVDLEGATARAGSGQSLAVVVGADGVSWLGGRAGGGALSRGRQGGGLLNISIDHNRYCVSQK